MKVLVTGATGFIGAWIVDAWLASGHDVRALVRDRQKAAAVLDARVEVIAGDATDPATMDRALEGREVLVHGAAAYRYGRGLGEEMQRTAPVLARTAFDAAKRAGTGHVIDISSGVVFAPHARRPAVSSPMSTPGLAAGRHPLARPVPCQQGARLPGDGACQVRRAADLVDPPGPGHRAA